jgi:hypothetical protein
MRWFTAGSTDRRGIHDPEMDGIELAREIRAVRAAHAPVVQSSRQAWLQ